jgi:hypothetical protein
VRITNSSAIRFRNVHIKSENGYAVCDASGCGRFLRAGKCAFENAVQDVTRHDEVRERELRCSMSTTSRTRHDRKVPLPQLRPAPRSETGKRLLGNSRRHGRPGWDPVFPWIVVNSGSSRGRRLAD